MNAARRPAAAPLRVLVVCTGNLCRSPLFAALLARDVDDARVTVTSRGTLTTPGAVVPAATLAAGTRLGVDLEGHVARPLSGVDLEDADLVLTAGRRHRRDVVRMSPAAASKAFTIVEFARLAEAALTEGAAWAADEGAVDSGPGRSGVALESLLRMRGSVLRPDDPEDDDVVDPMGRRAGVHLRVARRLATAATTIASALGPVMVDPSAGGPSRARRSEPGARDVTEPARAVSRSSEAAFVAVPPPVPARVGRGAVPRGRRVRRDGDARGFATA
ncbi:low molecular weight phosphatase family protein [Frigoribacterium sp. RIT-PI-h]|uniref:arsenate reductase/protein-tyrosine-phosphatase family protein n=1 Tax=Frigoribacterium sp. RIT-PI-h TaxID=1690245 RepID=UPI0006B8E70D|nr:low molecular weight phosphatase family protein [Frigoribacterium sp. RIT-PI-h]